jgi:hypothetical protein
MAAVQLAECTHWHRPGLAPNQFWARTGQLRPAVMPSVVRLHHHPLLISHCGRYYGCRVGPVNPRPTTRLTRGARACHAWSLLRGNHIDFFRHTIEEPCNIITQHATSYNVVMIRQAQGSREVTPSNDKEASLDATIHGVEEGVKGGKNRHDHDGGDDSDHNGGDDSEAGRSGA